MEQPRSDFEGIGSRVEELVFAPLRKLRQWLFGPLAALLAHLGIHADMLSFASVVFGFGFCLFAPFQFSLAFWLLVVSLVCDGLDGVVARQMKKNTIAGAFTDMCCDASVLTLCAAGLAWRGMIHPALRSCSSICIPR